MPLTSDTLQRVGIRLEPEEVEDLLLDVLDGMPAASPVTAPRHELTEPDAAALSRGGFELDPHALGVSDPLARTAAEYTALLAGSLTVAEAAAMLGVDTSRIRQRIAAGSLYAVKLRGGWRLPRFQFDANRPLPGLEEVAPRLDPSLHPVAVARWFSLPNTDLVIDDQPVSPRDWLRSGYSTAAVADIAAAL